MVMAPPQNDTRTALAPAPLRRQHHRLLLLIYLLTVVAVVGFFWLQDAMPRTVEADENIVLERTNGSSPPPGYPWNDLLGPSSSSSNTTGRAKLIDVDLLLTHFHNLSSQRPHLDLSSDGQGSQSIPYLVKNGQVLCPSNHLLEAQTFDWYGFWYRDRIRPFQEMLSEALKLGRSGGFFHAQFDRVVSVEIPIILNFGDYRGCSSGEDDGPWPRFTFAKEAHTNGSTSSNNNNKCGIPFALPGYETWTAHGRDKIFFPSDWDFVFQKRNVAYPWTSKLPMAVWRGSTTGVEANWRDLPRAKLVKHGMERPDVLDAGFTQVLQRSKVEMREIMKESRVVTREMDFDDFMKYRVIVDIDGNSWSSRLPMLLCTNSVVLKVEPAFVGYFYSELVPWEHYVPVRADMSDLVETIEYAVSDVNQEEMKRIVYNANEWCRNKMTRYQMALDTLWILVSYVELLDESSDGKWQKEESKKQQQQAAVMNTKKSRLGTEAPMTTTTKMVVVGELNSPAEARNELPYILAKSLLARIAARRLSPWAPLAVVVVLLFALRSVSLRKRPRIIHGSLETKKL